MLKKSRKGRRIQYKDYKYLFNVLNVQLDDFLHRLKLKSPADSFHGTFYDVYCDHLSA